MDKESKDRPKFKLAKAPSNQKVSADSQKDESTQAADKAKSLELKKNKASRQNDTPLDKIDDILEHAYGAEKKALKRKHLKKRLKHFSTRCLMVALCFAGTLIYAHGHVGIPVLKPVIWYLPFFFSAVLSTWFYFQSARYWDQAYQLLAIFGLIVAGALIYWNVHVLNFAASSRQKELSARLSVPENVAELYFTGEFDALHGVPVSQSAYARITPADCRRIFNAMPRDAWRGHFQRYLTAAEMDEINLANIDETLDEVTRRIVKKREQSLDRLEAEIQNPSLKFRSQQLMLRPYTWIISYL